MRENFWATHAHFGSPAAHDRDPVFYYESNDTPGLCVQRGDGKLSWSPMKVSKSAMKVGIPNSSGDSDLDIDNCTSFDYRIRDGVPGFDVETKSDDFWVPISHRTRNRLKQV